MAEMLSTFKTMLGQTAILFLFMMLGYILRRAKAVPDNAHSTLSKMETNLFIPAVILSSFMTNFTVEALKTDYVYVLWALLVMAISLIIALPLCTLFTKDAYGRRVYFFALAIGNFAFMGIAVVEQAFSDYLFQYMLFIIPLNFFANSIGIAIMKTKVKHSFKTLINPTIISLFVGAIIGLLSLSQYIPTPVMTTINMAKACMSPLAMIIAGMVIAGYKVKDMASQRAVYVCSLLRLIVIPVIIVLIMKLFGASDYNLVITLTLCAYAMPIPLNTVVFPAANGADTRIGASMALISNVLGIITIPLIFAILT